MAIKLISDSTCDLTPELLERYDITLAPLYVTQDGVTRRDGVDIHPQDIFDHVAAGGSLPSTSAVNIADYQELFSKYAQEYEAVIHFNIGQGFSACHQNAVIAAEDFDNVYVVDTRNLTMGQGLLVVEAAEAARSVSRGVYVCFHHNLIAGTRAVKMRTTSFDAFDSVNAPLCGESDAVGLHVYHPIEHAALAPAAFGDEINPGVFLLKLFPGTSPEAFRHIAAMGCKGLVLEAFGLGGLHYIRRNLVGALHELSEQGVDTLVATQCMYEKADFSIYEVGRDITGSNIYSARDMTTEAAVAKLMWVLGKPDVRKELLRQSLCLEMS